MLAYSQTLVQTQQSHRPEYPHFDVLTEKDVVLGAQGNLRKAVELDNSLRSRWALGRIALAAGDGDTAAEVLGPLLERTGHNSLLYTDALVALSLAGKATDVVAWYERAVPTEMSDAVRDAVALAFLDQATLTDSPREASGLLEKAAVLRPGDLYANYCLWKLAEESGKVESAAAFARVLDQFSLEALNPTDERLLVYAVEVIPFLLEAEVWDLEKTQNVVSFLVWWHADAAGVEQLLMRLGTLYPPEPAWSFYLGELYHRRGDQERARDEYLRTLEIAPGYAQAYLRLGMISEATGQELPEAATWYVHYHELAPEDLVGLQRLAQVCARLGTGESHDTCDAAALTLGEDRAGTEAGSTGDVFQRALAERRNDRIIASRLLDIPVEDVTLGPNLVMNGGYETWRGGRPEWWVWSDMFSRDAFAGALFVGGGDSLSVSEGQQAARVDGLWVEAQREQDTKAARAGFWQWEEGSSVLRPINLARGMPYLLSFDYRTARIPDGKVSVYVSADHNVLWYGDHKLPATDGEWHHFAALGWNRSESEAGIKPLLRSFVPGSFQFDNVQVRRVGLGKGTTMTESQFWTSGGS